MEKQIEISDNFWQEFELRGFSIEKETGGTYINKLEKGSITILNKKVTKIASKDGSYCISAIDPAIFFKTIKKIEHIVQYKLFN